MLAVRIMRAYMLQKILFVFRDGETGISSCRVIEAREQVDGTHNRRDKSSE
jgi:hypothetical protein